MIFMKILLDADATPVLKEVVDVASTYKIKLLIISDFNHHLDTAYGDIIKVDQANDSADHMIINNTVKNDLVITGDYGLAALVLAKHADAMHFDGWRYDPSNIDRLLNQRHFQQKQRRILKRYHHIPKRKSEQNKVFKTKLIDYLNRKGVVT